MPNDRSTSRRSETQGWCELLLRVILASAVVNVGEPHPLASLWCFQNENHPTVPAGSVSGLHIS